MTKQITIKLNESRFRPLMDKLRAFGGEGLVDSDSDLVGKALFYCYHSIYYKNPELGDKTSYDVISEKSGAGKSELLLKFLNMYHQFKKKGLKVFN